MNKSPIILLLFFLCSSLSAQIREDSDSLFHRTVTKWFSAWELVYSNIYGINDVKPVDFVLFDDQYIYSTSDVSVRNGSEVSGADLLNLSLKWKRKAHEGTLILPDGSSAPVGMMCFASENSNTGNPYFVMPLATFWEKQGIESKSLTLDNLVTGVFLHEFSHTQQMENFGKKITEFVKINEMGDDFDDNFIQNTFQNDSIFVKLYNKEITYFSEAIADKSSIETKKVMIGLESVKDRRNRFFVNQYANLLEIEDIFLTMEGLGQYTMYVWLTHEKGGNIDRNTAIEGVRRSKKVWSQDQGFLLFLILERYMTPDKWAKEMFGTNVTYVTDIIEKQQNKT